MRQKNQILDSVLLPGKSSWEAHGKHGEGKTRYSGAGSQVPGLLLRVRAYARKAVPMTSRRFPPPWSVDESATYFVVRDANRRITSHDHRALDFQINYSRVRLVRLIFCEFPDQASENTQRHLRCFGRTDHTIR